jgi:CheY-like chemotaxis protein
MGGDIWVESELGHGSTFSFTVQLKCGDTKHEKLLSEDVNWNNIKIFAVDDDPMILEFFEEISENLNIECGVAASGEEAVKMLEEKNDYDIYFIDWKLPGMNGIDLAGIINKKLADKHIIIIVSAMDWDIIESEARSAGANKYLPKPLFQSSIVNIIDECLRRGETAAGNSDNNEEDDFSVYTLLLVEDVEINREILMTLLEPTHVRIDCAENGVQALEMYSEFPDKYDLILMDVQMPEMDGYEATRRIRSLRTRTAKEIPIIAMTANVMTEDVERCLDSGMNEHVGKPFNIDEVLNILRKYLT